MAAYAAINEDYKLVVEAQLFGELRLRPRDLDGFEGNVTGDRIRAVRSIVLSISLTNIDHEEAGEDITAISH